MGIARRPPAARSHPRPSERAGGCRRLLLLSKMFSCFSRLQGLPPCLLRGHTAGMRQVIRARGWAAVKTVRGALLQQKGRESEG